MPDKDSYADKKLRDAFSVKGLSRETIEAIRAGELEIEGDDEQTKTLKKIAGQEED